MTIVQMIIGIASLVLAGLFLLLFVFAVFFGRTEVGMRFAGAPVMGFLVFSLWSLAASGLLGLIWLVLLGIRAIR